MDQKYGSFVWRNHFSGDEVVIRLRGKSRTIPRIRPTLQRLILGTTSLRVGDCRYQTFSNRGELTQYLLQFVLVVVSVE